MSSTQRDAEEQAHRNTISALAESRQLAKESLTHSEAGGVPPYQTIINPSPPTPTDITGGRSYKPPWADALRSLHTAILEFWDEVRIYRKRAPELWAEPLCEVGYPVQGEDKRRKKDYRKSHFVRGIEQSTRPVSLKDLGWWRHRQVRLLCRYTERFGNTEKVTERAEKVYLPPVAAKESYQQLNDVLEEIGLAAKITAVPHRTEEPGV